MIPVRDLAPQRDVERGDRSCLSANGDILRLIFVLLVLAPNLLYLLVGIKGRTIGTGGTPCCAPFEDVSCDDASAGKCHSRKISLFFHTMIQSGARRSLNLRVVLDSCIHATEKTVVYRQELARVSSKWTQREVRTLLSLCSSCSSSLCCSLSPPNPPASL